MRLIRTDNLKLEDLYGLQIPSYAILSHRWGREVSYQELQTYHEDPAFSNLTTHPGFIKISNAARIALNNYGCEYIWIDTCCINKQDLAELGGAINSMYQWYGDAAVCIAYLADVDLTVSTIDKSEWFERGWTLQELIAPRVLDFYNSKWQILGDRTKFHHEIKTATKIDERVLKGDKLPSECSVSERMCWASRRKTQRREDLAYCLLGIFDVNMPLLYGEGAGAFRRLQEEIVKRNNDMTIFAWRKPENKAPPTPSFTVPSPEGAVAYKVGTPATLTRSVRFQGVANKSEPQPQDSLSTVHTQNMNSVSTDPKPSKVALCRVPPTPVQSLFAPSPSFFSDIEPLVPFKDEYESFTVTNKGLHMAGSTNLRVYDRSHDNSKTLSPDSSGTNTDGTPLSDRYLLLLGSRDHRCIGMFLTKIGPNLFERDWSCDMLPIPLEEIEEMRGILVSDWRILIDSDINPRKPRADRFRDKCLHIPQRRDPGHANHWVTVRDTAPHDLWDVRDSVFVRPKASRWVFYDMVLALKCEIKLPQTGVHFADNPTRRRSLIVEFMVLIDYHKPNQPHVHLFATEQHPDDADYIMAKRMPANALLWVDLTAHKPYLKKKPGHVYVDVGSDDGKGCVYRIQAKAKIQTVKLASMKQKPQSVVSILFDVRRDEHIPSGEVEPDADIIEISRPEGFV